jgi:dipeptidase D
VPRLKEVYREQNGEDAEVVALHAGLECGAFAELSGDIDIASIGPDITGAHSVEEKLYLRSIPKVWHWIEKTITSLE